jgi:predicted transcriptional regulator
MSAPRPDLASVRRARGFSQADVARHLKTAQADVSKLEHRDDPRLSTLVRYIEALGGELELHARFADGRVALPYHRRTGRPRRQGT